MKLIYSLIIIIFLLTPVIVRADDHGDTVNSATLISVNNVIDGEIEYSKLNPIPDWDYFSFYAVNGNSYAIKITLRTLPTAVLNLWETDSTVLAADMVDNKYDSTATLTWKCQSSGTYYVSIDGAVLYTGTYTLTIIEL